MKYFALSLVLLSGCASMSPKLLPSAARTKAYTIETKLKKDAAFSKISTWAAKGGGETRVNDRTSDTVVVKANVACDALKLGNGYASDQALWFVMELVAEDNRVTATFSDLLASTPGGSWDSGTRPSTQAEVDLIVSECVEPLKASLIQSL